MPLGDIQDSQFPRQRQSEGHMQAPPCTLVPDKAFSSRRVVVASLLGRACSRCSDSSPALRPAGGVLVLSNKMGFCKVSTWKPRRWGNVGQLWEQVRLKAVTTQQPRYAEETSHSRKDLLLKVAGVRAGDVCRSYFPQPQTCCGIALASVVGCCCFVSHKMIWNTGYHGARLGGRKMKQPGTLCSY